MINCIKCNQPLQMAKSQRKTGYLTGYCKECKFSHTICFNRDESSYLVRIEHRFSHNKTTWCMTYRTKENETKYFELQYRNAKTHEPVPRIEHKLAGFVLPERFLDLLAFYEREKDK